MSKKRTWSDQPQELEDCDICLCLNISCLGGVLELRAKGNVMWATMGDLFSSETVKGTVATPEGVLKALEYLQKGRIPKQWVRMKKEFQKNHAHLFDPQNQAS